MMRFGLWLGVCAQRLSASEVNAVSAEGSGDDAYPVLNAFRRQRLMRGIKAFKRMK